MLMDKDINCLNFKGLIAYIRKRYADEGVKHITAGLLSSETYQVEDKYNPSKLIPMQEQQ